MKHACEHRVSMRSQVRAAKRELAKEGAKQERLASVRQATADGALTGARPATKPGAGKPPRSKRALHTPDFEREARQLANANKQLAYYIKDNEILKRKLAHAERMDAHLEALEASVAAQSAALTDATKRGRELLMRQKEQAQPPRATARSTHSRHVQPLRATATRNRRAQPPLATATRDRRATALGLSFPPDDDAEQARALGGVDKEDSKRRLQELREDVRVAKERVRRQQEQNEADGAALATLERRCADLSAEVEALAGQYERHQVTVAKANDATAVRGQGVEPVPPCVAVAVLGRGGAAWRQPACGGAVARGRDTGRARRRVRPRFTCTCGRLLGRLLRRRRRGRETRPRSSWRLSFTRRAGRWRRSGRSRSS